VRELEYLAGTAKFKTSLSEAVNGINLNISGNMKSEEEFFISNLIYRI